MQGVNSFFLCLQLIGETCAQFKGLGINILEVAVMGMAHEIAATHVE